jgi:hypothetical protein
MAARIVGDLGAGEHICLDHADAGIALDPVFEERELADQIAGIGLLLEIAAQQEVFGQRVFRCDAG